MIERILPWSHHVASPSLVLTWAVASYAHSKHWCTTWMISGRLNLWTLRKLSTKSYIYIHTYCLRHLLFCSTRLLLVTITFTLFLERWDIFFNFGSVSLLHYSSRDEVFFSILGVKIYFYWLIFYRRFTRRLKEYNTQRN